MLGKLVVQGSTPSAELGIDDPNLKNLAAEVCRKEKEVFVPSTPNAAGWTSENLKKNDFSHFFWLKTLLPGVFLLLFLALITLITEYMLT